MTAALVQSVETDEDTRPLVVLRSQVSRSFWAEANWDPVLGLVRPAPTHPTLGWPCCIVAGCQVRSRGGGTLCTGCLNRLRRTGVPQEVFVAQPPPKTSSSAHKRIIDELCAVPGCPRPQHTMTIGLCNSHRSQCHARFGDLNTTTVRQFLDEPDVHPLPSLGPCQVESCLRLAERCDGLCLTHRERWRLACAREPQADFEIWCRTEPGITRSGLVNLRGLPELVVHQMLVGVQRRAERGNKISPDHWQLVARHARLTQSSCLLDIDPSALRREPALLLRALQREAYLATTSWEQEQQRDVWELGVVGRPGKIDFTGISQPWLRHAVKAWVAQDMPKRAWSHKLYGVWRDHVRSLAELSTSLRLHRPDHGDDHTALGRADILAFLTRIAHFRHLGTLTEARHVRLLRQTRMVLLDCRDLGLTRPGGCLAGMPGDFGIRRSDLPRDPDQRSWRSLPAEVIRQLDQALVALEERSGREYRLAVELLMDTGRRPDEICQLRLHCLDRDGDGGDVLLYTDYKKNRLDRRLPIAASTAELIRKQQNQARRRFPQTLDTDLPLLPAPLANAHGTKSIRATGLTTIHREWIDRLPPLLLDDGSIFPAADVVPYAYRHSYAQRHADAGTPVDVLRDLMGHRSTAATQVYYRVTEQRTRAAVERLADHQYNGRGQRLWREASQLLDSERTRMRVGQVAVPFGICTEPSNVQAGGGACPYRLRCLGCGHFRTDASYLPELRTYLDRLLADRERVLAATDLDQWAQTEAAPSTTEITKVRQLIHRLEHDLDNLTDEEHQQIRDACTVLRKTRQVVHLGLPTISPSAVDVRAIGRTG